MSEIPETRPEVLRWYTSGRRLQRLIGKAPGGGYYPGGPYTITQVVGGCTVLVALTLTKGVWGTGNWLLDTALIPVGLAVATLFGLKLVKPGGRNPLSAGFALVGALVAPRHGRHNGKALRLGRPHRVHHHIQVDLHGLLEVPAVDVAPSPAPAAVLSATEPERRPNPQEQAPVTVTQRSLRTRPALRPVPTPSPQLVATTTGESVPALSGIQRRLSGARAQRRAG